MTPKAVRGLSDAREKVIGGREWLQDQVFSQNEDHPSTRLFYPVRGGEGAVGALLLGVGVRFPEIGLLYRTIYRKFCRVAITWIDYNLSTFFLLKVIFHFRNGCRININRIQGMDFMPKN